MSGMEEPPSTISPPGGLDSMSDTAAIRMSDATASQEIMRGHRARLRRGLPTLIRLKSGKVIGVAMSDSLAWAYTLGYYLGGRRRQQVRDL